MFLSLVFSFRRALPLPSEPRGGREGQKGKVARRRKGNAQMVKGKRRNNREAFEWRKGVVVVVVRVGILLG